MPTNYVQQSNLFHLTSIKGKNRTVAVAAQEFDETDEDLPIPPAKYMQYNESAERHISGGRRDAGAVREILTAGGFDIGRCKRFLELGSSNGRILRHFADWARVSEGWGADINAMTTWWAATHLRPPFRFAVTTTNPHLPFPDNHFGLAYAISVFTHIDDLFMSWIAELARVTCPGGYLFVSLHDDEGTMPALKEGHGKALAEYLLKSPEFPDFEAGKTVMLSIEQGVWGILPFFKRSFFLDVMSDHFDIISVTDRAIAHHQTGILGRRKG